MSRKQYAVGLDVGTTTIRAVIAELPQNREEPLRVVGVGNVPSVGIRRGIVVNTEEVAKSVNKALELAERMAGTPIEGVTASISGTDLFAQQATGVVAVGKSDGEVTEEDLVRIVEETQARTPLSQNKEILHVVPQYYRLDDQSHLKDPVGLKGVRLELSALVIGTGSNQLKNLSRSLELAGVTVNQFVAEPLASVEAVLAPKQKDLGVVMVNIGGSTTSVAVFEDGDLLHLAVLPVGGNHITNDIAIGLRTSIEVAEGVKLQYGHAFADEIGKKEEIPLSEFDSQESDVVLRHHVAEIIEARLDEIFHYINLELQSINREALLPAGAVLTGGGVLIPGTVDLAKKKLRLPAQIGYPKPLGGILDQVDSPTFATVVGLLLLSVENNPLLQKGGKGIGIENMLPGNFKEILGKTKRLFGRFLP